jgi:hypothetical protein
LRFASITVVRYYLSKLLSVAGYIRGTIILVTNLINISKDFYLKKMNEFLKRIRLLKLLFSNKSGATVQSEHRIIREASLPRNRKRLRSVPHSITSLTLSSLLLRCQLRPLIKQYKYRYLISYL